VRQRVLAPLTGFPFNSRADRRFIVHCCHHKVGTVWFRNVLGGVGKHFGMAVHMSPGHTWLPETEIFVQHDAELDLGTLPPFRGSHLVRDPRDVIVSGYFYHMRCDEPWSKVPDPEFGGLSYQEYLLSLDKEAGIHAEMAGRGGITIQDMAKWDYARPEILELRYEEMLGAEDAQWMRIFRHYGFREKAAQKAALIARRYSLERPEYRAWRTKHIRSGQPGDWRNHFSKGHRDAFKEHFPGVLRKLGYERDDDW